MSEIDLSQMILTMTGETLKPFLTMEGNNLFEVLEMILSADKGQPNRKIDDVRTARYVMLKIAHAHLRRELLELKPEEVVSLSEMVNNFEQPGSQQMGIEAKKLPILVVSQICEMLEGSPNPFAAKVSKQEQYDSNKASIEALKEENSELLDDIALELETKDEPKEENNDGDND